jgi:hypothetical protein
LSDQFETGATGWTTSGLWHLATTLCVSPGYHSATHAFYYGQESTCNYATGSATSGTLTSPLISGVGGSATFTFWYWRQVESYKQASYDQASVSVSYDGGTTWTRVWFEDTKSPSENAWTLAAIPLSPTSSTLRLQFTFNSIDGLGNNYKGWLIDDVVVTNN